MTADRPKVLLGIVTRDRADLLRRSIDSAIAQRGANLTVAVMDDGSKDKTVELSAQFPEVQWSRRKESSGYMSARNELMARCNYDYFASLDDDAWFLEGDEIMVAVNYLERSQHVAAVAFDILSPDKPNKVERTAAEAAAMFIGCGHLLRLEAVREVGFYEPVPGTYGGEEKDLCLRLLDAGYAIAFLRGVHVWHDKTHVTRELLDQHRSGVCNDLAMTLRRVPFALLPFAFAAKIYRHFLFALRNGAVGSCLQGLGLFARSIPALWQSRSPVKASTLRNFIKLSATRRSRSTVIG